LTATLAVCWHRPLRRAADVARPRPLGAPVPVRRRPVEVVPADRAA